MISALLSLADMRFYPHVFRILRNVSTMEVSQVLSSFPGVEEANVYGVQALRPWYTCRAFRASGA